MLAESKPLRRLCREAKGEAKTFHLEELVGGALSCYAAEAIERLGGVHIFVADDRDSAAYLMNDFYRLLDEERVCFFPTSYKRSAAYGTEDAQGVVQRTSTLSALRNFAGGTRSRKGDASRKDLAARAERPARTVQAVPAAAKSQPAPSAESFACPAAPSLRAIS